MDSIMLIGKLNEPMKDLNTYLKDFFNVQICSESPDVVGGMIKIVHPKLIIISLIGTLDIEPRIFNIIHNNYKDIPVLTIGTEGEQKKFLDFYSGRQFENLIRPIDNNLVLEAICRRLDIDPKVLLEGGAVKTGADEKKLVLIVDDNAAVLRSTKAMLDENYKVAVATSGIKAMTALGKRRPDVILLDYEMPVCDGRQTLEMIRAEEEFADIPVIFLTGVSDREHIEAVLGLRPAGYLLKPAVKQKLLEEIAKVV